MCLAIPGKVLDSEEIGGLRIGRIQFGGITRKAYLDYVPDALPGDYVMVHAGFAISKVDEAEAARAFAMMRQMGLLEEELGGDVVDDKGLGDQASPTPIPCAPGTVT
jgi:hydrogenase expression/formation protein HypC